MQYPFLFLFIIGLMFLHTTDACGKRPMRSTTSSSVPPTTSSMYNSSEGTTTPYSYKLPCNRTETRLMGCLHKGTCFVIIIQKTRERNCNCPHKWTGKRCQELSPELFAPTVTDPNKLRTAHIAAGVVGTIIIVLVIVSSVYCYVRVKKKERSMPHRHRQNGANNTHVNSLGKEVPALELQPLGQAV